MDEVPMKSGPKLGAVIGLDQLDLEKTPPCLHFCEFARFPSDTRWLDDVMTRPPPHVALGEDDIDPVRDHDRDVYKQLPLPEAGSGRPTLAYEAIEGGGNVFATLW